MEAKEGRMYQHALVTARKRSLAEAKLRAAKKKEVGRCKPFSHCMRVLARASERATCRVIPLTCPFSIGS